MTAPLPKSHIFSRTALIQWALPAQRCASTSTSEVALTIATAWKTHLRILRPFPLLPMPPVLTTQHPFDLNNAQRDCLDWQLTSARITNAAAFLDAVQPYPLKNAEGGTAYLNADPATMDLGKRAFAENCALVSTDPRMAIGTNADRALETNPIGVHIWQNFSSRTFKDLPSPGTMTVENPFDKGAPISFPIRHGGYYRTPSLINMWATAPFFENNMLGAYTGDPSVKGRMTAFNDAAEKLL
jgi:hypothetical protein